jgi:hypothetical protein
MAADWCGTGIALSRALFLWQGGALHLPVKSREGCFVRKIVISGLVAVAALLGVIVPSPASCMPSGSKAKTVTARSGRHDSGSPGVRRRILSHMILSAYVDWKGMRDL